MSTTAEEKDLLRDAPLPLIAARIRRARKALGLSHDTLGEKMGGVSRQHLIKLEKGRHRPGLEMLQQIAAATEKPLDYFLVEDAGEPNPFGRKTSVSPDVVDVLMDALQLYKQAAASRTEVRA